MVRRATLGQIFPSKNLSNFSQCNATKVKAQNTTILLALERGLGAET